MEHPRLCAGRRSCSSRCGTPGLAHRFHPHAGRRLTCRSLEHLGVQQGGFMLGELLRRPQHADLAMQFGSGSPAGEPVVEPALGEPAEYSPSASNP